MMKPLIDVPEMNVGNITNEQGADMRGEQE